MAEGSRAAEQDSPAEERARRPTAGPASDTANERPTHPGSRAPPPEPTGGRISIRVDCERAPDRDDERRRDRAETEPPRRADTGDHERPASSRHLDSAGSSIGADLQRLANVDDVKRDFIKLIRHNKSQCFYLAALIYSVMNLGLIISSSVQNQVLEPQRPDRRNYSSSAPTDRGLGALDSRLGLWLALGALAPLALLLALIAAITTLRFGRPPAVAAKNNKAAASANSAPVGCVVELDAGAARTRAKPADEPITPSSPPGERWLHAAGVATTLALLSLPQVCALLLGQGGRRPPDHVAVRGAGGLSGAPLAGVEAATTLLYLEPLVVEGSALNGPITYALTIILGLAAAPGERLHVYATLGAVYVAALSLGLLKRRQFVRTVAGSTFAGAAQLIEARVSLEHQRQQQETLLLSVLPAYVAEQVKRNMVKKINSSPAPADSDGAELTGALAAQGNGLPSAVPAAITVQLASNLTNSWLKTIATALPSHQADQLIAGQSLSPSAALLRAPLASQRSSLSRLSATGGASAGETLAGPKLPADQHRLSSSSMPAAAHARGAESKAVGLSVSTHHVAGHSPSVATPSALQSQNFAFSPLGGAGAAGSSQARRGFNELYIRTYNNVSLLYGDIVGFTRLCTQLSSSQLVRVLNDLFSHFDRLAERHKIMRIKILGDCYYGVSGIPEFAVMGAKSRASRHDNHATNCVNMGLDMIQYIKCLNVERASRGSVPLDALPHSLSVAGTSLADAPATSGSRDDSKSAGSCTPVPQFELNMRIGIHSGHIHSGVIGLKKWQFDVWSNDVSIAMHCESSGVAGRIQVTEATIQQLNGAFTYEPTSSTGSSGDPFLASRDIKTFLIRDRVSSGLYSQVSSLSVAGAGPAPDATSAGGRGKRTKSSQQRRRSDARNDKSKTDNEDTIRSATIETIKDTLLAGETCNSNTSNAYALALNHPDIRFTGLDYRDTVLNKLYTSRSVGYYNLELLTIVLVLVVALPALNYTLTGESHAPLAKIEFALLLAAFALDFLITEAARHKSSRSPRSSVVNYDQNAKPETIYARVNSYDLDVTVADRESQRDEKYQSSQLLSRLRRTISSCDRKLGRVFRAIKMFLYREFPRGRFRSLMTVSVISAVISMQSYFMVDSICVPSEQDDNADTLRAAALYQLSVILVLIATDLCDHLIAYRAKNLLQLAILFMQLTYLVAKNLSGTGRLACDGERGDRLARESPSVSAAAVVDWTSDTLVLMLAFLSLAYGRQLEYTRRANFLWRNRLSVDHEELEYISGINKVLLENILPSHVVQHYMMNPSEHQKSLQLPALPRMSFSNMRSLSDELYHEQHDSVAVMFASIPHFYEFYDESDISKQGLGCIALLNEIICDFDKLLLKNKFSRIEKIKTIGSTYMAAAGLRPANLNGARGSNVSQASARVPVSKDAVSNHGGYLDNLAVSSEIESRKLVMSQQKLNLVCMIQFATSLMAALNGINKQSFQVFRLRVGVNTGSVIAGIIGAQRPFYDIWGDCVNIASRMESLGEIGRIQVEEKTAKLLIESLCSETHSIVKRGHIDVKGKGGMVTYFVDKRPTGQTRDTTNSEAALG